MSTPQNLNTAITLLLAITAQAGRVSAAIAAARAEARDLTADELAGLQAEDDAARAALVDSIGRASG